MTRLTSPISILMKGTSDVPVTLDCNVPNMFYTYILFSLKDKKLYIGYTTDLNKRLSKHAQGLVIATKYRRPLKLIHYEYFSNISDAKAREVFLKSGGGHDQIRAMMKRTLAGY